MKRLAEREEGKENAEKISNLRSEMQNTKTQIQRWKVCVQQYSICEPVSSVINWTIHDSVEEIANMKN